MDARSAPRCEASVIRPQESEPGPAGSHETALKKFLSVSEPALDWEMAATYILGPFRLDAETDTLFRGGEPVSLGHRAVALLRVLVEQRGIPVSKDALMEAAWAGLTVEESNLAVQIAALRRVFGEEPGGEHWIETLPRRGYRFVGPASIKQITDAAAPLVASSPGAPDTASLPLPVQPSIVVLPFQNMSGDPEQDYFADGMVEEIITTLSRFRSLFVIARNSSFTYKGRSVDVKQVGRKLGVRYALEGAVRKASGKVRITGQLVDAVTGAHIWADRFERDLTDVFALQDEVTAAVVSAIQPKLLQTEIAISTRRRPENLTAYDYYLRAIQQNYVTTREGMAEAIRLAHRALELDPRFGLAASLAGAAHMGNVIWGFAVDPQFDRKEAIRLLRLALSVDDGDPDTLAWASLTSAFMVGDSESEIEMADRAVALNPNSFWAWHARGWAYKIAGLHEEAVRSFERAIRTSPIDPVLHRSLVG